MTYIQNITFLGDLRIIFTTLAKVFKRSDITEENCDTATDLAGYLLAHGQIFDMNGQLIKSTNVKAASVGEAWKSVKSGLQNGMYIMRYGVESRNGKASEMRTVQVRK